MLISNYMKETKLKRVQRLLGNTWSKIKWAEITESREKLSRRKIQQDFWKKEKEH